VVRQYVIGQERQHVQTIFDHKDCLVSHRIPSEGRERPLLPVDNSVAQL
jgi:hypothetical protein